MPSRVVALSARSLNGRSQTSFNANVSHNGSTSERLREAGLLSMPLRLNLRNAHGVEAIIRRWLREGAKVVVPAPCLAECMRGTARDAAANRLLKAIDYVVATSEAIARTAGTRLGSRRSSETVDALVVATAESCSATDILTTDPTDIVHLAGPTLRVISL